MANDFHKVGYYWMPAALDESGALGHVGVKYGSNAKFGASRVKRDNTTVYGFQFPDRRIYISRNDLPDEFDVDETHNFDIASGHWLKGNSRYAMVNAATAPSKLSQDRLGIKKAAYVVQDSGGFQLVEKREFVDPADVIAKHQLYAHTGVCLDPPPHGLKDPKLVEGSAKALLLNNQFMKTFAKKAGLDLMNVSHGLAMQGRKRYLDITLEEPMDSLAIGSLKSSFSKDGRTEVSPYPFAAHVLWTILYTKKYYTHFHVLGISTRWQMAVMALIAHKCGVTITSDSSTYVMFGKSGLEHNFSMLNKKVGEQKQFSLAPVDCACGICSALKYKMPYMQLGNLLSIHNYWSIAYGARVFNALARGYPWQKWFFENIPPAADSQFKGQMVKALELIDRVKTYKDVPDVDVIPKTGLAGASLFREQGNKKDERFKRILHNYAEYHKAKIL